MRANVNYKNIICWKKKELGNLAIIKKVHWEFQGRHALDQQAPN
jgi:hypothetical protein